MGPEPALCTRFSHLKSGRHLLPPGQASERLASAHALTPPLAPPPQPTLPSPQPFFWPLFSLPPSFSEGTNLPVLVVTITFLKKIIPPRGALGSHLPTPAHLPSFTSLCCLEQIKEREERPTSQRSLLVSGFATHSCGILQRSPGYLVCGGELSMPPCLWFSVSSMN